MATTSVIEIIGGIDNDGGINNGESSLSGGTNGVLVDEDGNVITARDLLWLNPDVGNHIYGIVAILKVIGVSLIWFLWL